MDSFFNHLAEMLIKFPAYAPFMMLILIIGFIMYRAHISSDSKFTVFDLIQDKDTGKGSLEKIGLTLAYLTITWWFVDTAAQCKAGVEEVLAYGGLMGLTKAYNSWLSAKYNKPIEPQ